MPRAPANAIVFHIPHASRRIAPEREFFLLDDQELDRELTRMTDAFTDELVATALPDAARVRFPLSRLVVDPERFVDDADEPMSRAGMGVLYERTSCGAPLRARPDIAKRWQLLQDWYHPHHHALDEAVQDCLREHGRCLVLDIHSFPSLPRPYELDPAAERPDICLGTDAFHTPPRLRDYARQVFEGLGLRVAIDRPYAGAMVPLSLYRRDRRVGALMLEVNRDLYMDEDSGAKLESFDGLRRLLATAIEHIVAFHRSVGSFLALHGAAARGDVTTVEQLLASGADLHSVDRRGGSALHVAAGEHRHDVAKLLIRRGIDVLAVDGDGSSALDRALDAAGEALLPEPGSFSDGIGRVAIPGYEGIAVIRDGNFHLTLGPERSTATDTGDGDDILHLVERSGSGRTLEEALAGLDTGAPDARALAADLLSQDRRWLPWLLRSSRDAKEVAAALLSLLRRLDPERSR